MWFIFRGHRPIKLIHCRDQNHFSTCEKCIPAARDACISIFNRRADSARECVHVAVSERQAHCVRCCGGLAHYDYTRVVIIIYIWESRMKCRLRRINLVLDGQCSLVRPLALSLCCCVCGAAEIDSVFKFEATNGNARTPGGYFVNVLFSLIRRHDICFWQNCGDRAKIWAIISICSQSLRLPPRLSTVGQRKMVLSGHNAITTRLQIFSSTRERISTVHLFALIMDACQVKRHHLLPLKRIRSNCVCANGVTFFVVVGVFASH